MADNIKGRLLVVDDSEINRTILQEILQDTYEITQAADGFEAIEYMFNAETLPDMVLLDIMMPEMDGFEVCNVMKQTPSTEKIPVIFITADIASDTELKGLSLGAIDFVTKPFIPEIVKMRVDNYMELTKYREYLEREVEKKAAALSRTQEHMLEALAGIIEFRDIVSGEHTKRTSNLTRILIEKLFTNPKYSDMLKNLNYEVIINAAPMHDIGKISVPDYILLKPGKLTPEEYEQIKKHSEIGGQIIESLKDKLDDVFYRHCRDICLYHHERWDGKGYPYGLKENEIPLSARILAVVDVFDALVSERPYKKPFDTPTALKIIAEGAGTQFDPDIASVFIDIHKADA